MPMRPLDSMRRSGRETAAQRRERRLAEIREQVASGRLIIRQATAEERERFGIRGETECR